MEPRQQDSALWKDDPLGPGLPFLVYHSLGPMGEYQFDSLADTYWHFLSNSELIFHGHLADCTLTGQGDGSKFQQ